MAISTHNYKVFYLIIIYYKYGILRGDYMSETKTVTLGKGVPIEVYMGYITFSRVLNFIVSFLVGQAFIFKTINPFVIPYLVVQLNRKKGNFAISLISAYMGVVFTLLEVIDISDFLGLPYFQAYLTQYTVAFILVICARVIFERSKVKFSKNVKLFISFVTSLASLVVILAFESFGSYYIMLGLYVVVSSVVIPLFIGEGAYILTLSIPKNKTKINDSEIFSVALLMSILLIGASRVNFLGISLFLVLLFVYILNLAFLFGGVVSGMITLITVGLFSILTSNIDANIVLFITFATIVGGFLRKEKYLVVLAFGSSIYIAYFLNKQIFFDYDLLTLTISFIFGSMLFMVSPTKFFREVAIHSEPIGDITDVVSVHDYENYTKEFKVEKINEQYLNIGRFDKIIENFDLSNDCTCTECISQMEKVRTLKNLFIQKNSIVKTNYRDLIADFNEEIVFNKTLEKNILKALVSKKVKFEDVKIRKNEYDKYEVVLFTDRYPLVQFERDALEEVLDKYLKAKFIQLPTITQNEKSTKIFFHEKYDFRFSYGIAMGTKDGGKISGDSYSILDLENHHTVIALSDGMGTGECAKAISTATLDTLDDLLLSNIEVEKAIDLVNSMMLLQAKEEEFATLDLCKINKYTGDCNIYKAGSAQTYILRNKKVRSINSGSLPIGIMEKIDVKNFKFKISAGDYIIMVTDGVSELDKEMLDCDRWLIDILEEGSFKQPQDLANHILSKASKIEDGVLDDKSVVVCKVF